MVQLYERVEAATQYVFSGAAFRSLLLWASEKEERGVGHVVEPSLAAAARKHGAPVRKLLQLRPLASADAAHGTDPRAPSGLAQYAAQHDAPTNDSHLYKPRRQPRDRPRTTAQVKLPTHVPNDQAMLDKYNRLAGLNQHAFKVPNALPARSALPAMKAHARTLLQSRTQ